MSLPRGVKLAVGRARRLLRKHRFYVVVPKVLADAGLAVNRLYYRQLLHATYQSGSHSPSWFDHRIDLYYHWPQNLFWLERGVLPRLHMSQNCRVLDLFCGDGFFSRYFYATIAGHIDAIDKDPRAIAHAHRLHHHPKITHRVIDAVTQGFPGSNYDAIVWFEGIEHLDQHQYDAVIRRIKGALSESGVVIGSTPILADADVGHANWEHQNEFTSIDRLREFLETDFRDVHIDTTTHPVYRSRKAVSRTTAYFTLRGPKPS